MTNTALAAVTSSPTDTAYSIMENVVADGDLSKLTPKQRVEYYHKTCESLGLNPLTRPLEYQRFNGKVVLYARKECTEQLRFMHKVSIYKMEKETFDGVFVVTAYARTADGKEDVSTGAVPIHNLKGEALANAFMKAETKAKRRVTLSVCGLGYLDENEVNTIAGSQPVKVDHLTGEIEQPVLIAAPAQPAIQSTREQIIDAVKNASSLDNLKNAYARAYTFHKGVLSDMEDINKLKDERKAHIERSIAEFQEEVAYAEALDAQGSIKR